MPDAFIYDHVRTPRGRGKVDGSLHEVTALNLASQALGAIKDRNDLDPTHGRRRGVGRGRSGRRSRRRYRAHGGAGRRLRRHRARRADQPLLRLRPRRGQFRRRADHVGTAGHGDRRRRRIDEPRRHWRFRRRLGGRSDHRGRALFHAARHLRRSHRHQIRIFARRRRRLCGRKPKARRNVVEGRPLQPLGHEGEGRQRTDHPRQGRAHAARRDHAVARFAQALLRADGRNGRLRCGRRSEASGSRVRQPRPPCRQFVGHRRRRRRGSARQQRARAKRRI